MSIQYVHEHMVEVELQDSFGNDAYSYLENHLSASEAQPLFDEAKNKGFADFVSSAGHHYRLSHGGDKYFIEHR